MFIQHFPRIELRFLYIYMCVCVCVCVCIPSDLLKSTGGTFHKDHFALSTSRILKDGVVFVRYTHTLYI